MAVKLRLKRIGRRNMPFYRLVAVDSRKKRDGKVIEVLGHYNPRAEKDDEKIRMVRERISYWLSQGAKPSETVSTFLRKQGIKTGD